MDRKRRRITGLLPALVLLSALLATSCQATDPVRTEDPVQAEESAQTSDPVQAEGLCQTILEGMTTEEKVSQMIMPAFRNWPDSKGNAQPVTVLNDAIAGSLARHGYAGVALFAENTGETAAAVRLTDAMQRANARGENRTQLLMAVDQEGGRVTRLGQGTQMPGNMALGAAGSGEDAAAAAAIIGREILATGLNLDFAPVLDVNSNPANPVIGTRSFSDDPRMTADLGVRYMQGIQSAGAIPTLKHFPGHGDTSTDSHTGLPSINKSYNQLKQVELVPFQVCIDAGAEAIMTAHIQFPQIEKGTYISKKTGESITLPATLSRTIVTDILRGDMGFSGVVITDALGMDAIQQHFDRLDAARLAIGAGVDILLMPVDTSSQAGLQDLDRYITDLTALVENGTIPSARVDEAVLRILHLKEKHGLLNPYDSGNVESRAAEAAAFVGSRENHETEWAITKRAVTLVKNQGNVLPLIQTGKQVAVLAPSSGEAAGLKYAVDRLRDEGKLSASVQIHSIQKLTFDQIRPLIRGVDHVIVVTELRGASGLRGDSAALIDRIISQVHGAGGTVTVLSAGLPYDAARYQAAEALLLTWSAQSMSEDPRTASGPVSSYGPNLPAALYLALSPDETPLGKLPVNIPALDGNNRYTGSVLYSRGFGLTYPDMVIRHDPPESCDDPANCPILPFRDSDPGGWYHDGLHYVLEKGIMDGVDTDRFAPGAPTTRAMTVTMLWRLAGSPDANGAGFDDVPEDSWYAAAVSWAEEKGIAQGVEDGIFAPDEPVTREQLAAILYRYAGTEGQGFTGDWSFRLDYADASDVSDWAYEPLCWMTMSEIIQGKDGGLLAPRDNASRAEVATMLMRYLEGSGPA